MTIGVDLVEVDTDVLGYPVFSVSGIESAEDLDDAVRVIDSSADKTYAVCKLPIERIDLVHEAQARGFAFVEVQLRTSLRIKHAPEGRHDAYTYVRIDEREELDEVLEIAGHTVEHDRFSRDPVLDATVSGERYRRYLVQSFETDGEEIWSVRSVNSGRLLTFRSHRIISPTEVLLLNGGVHPAHKGAGLGVISSHFCFAQLRESGIARAVSHISAANAPIINLELGYCNFRVTDSFVVLRRAT